MENITKSGSVISKGAVDRVRWPEMKCVMNGKCDYRQ